MAHEPEQEFPDTSKTYAIILGASKWPEMPKLKASETFTRSAEALRAYLLDDKRGMGLPEDNVLWLFNSEELPANLGLRIRQFLGKSEETNKYAGYDILIYYTGHGAFTQGEQKFQLLVHATRESQFNDTGYRMSSLATDLNAVARQARKYVILDCCHSAAAFEALQGQNVHGIAEKIELEQEIDFAEDDDVDLNPSKVKGTALLTACDEDQWAFYEDGDNRLTMFSGGLIEVLRSESKEGKSHRSIGEVYRALRRSIRRAYGEEAVLPRLYFPKGDEDPLRLIPIFPTPNALELASLNQIEALRQKENGAVSREPNRNNTEQNPSAINAVQLVVSRAGPEGSFVPKLTSLEIMELAKILEKSFVFEFANLSILLKSLPNEVSQSVKSGLPPRLQALEIVSKCDDRRAVDTLIEAIEFLDEGSSVATCAREFLEKIKKIKVND